MAIEYPLKEKNIGEMPHLGDMVLEAMRQNLLTKAEAAARLGMAPSSLGYYTQVPSLQTATVWQLSVGLKYDFFGRMCQALPPEVVLVEHPRITALEQEVADLKKEVAIYKAALGIKNGGAG